MHRHALVLGLVICCWLAAGPVQAEDWPGWRGPRGDGTSRDQHVPIRWDGASGENIAWKVPLAGKGHASPIVCKDRVFVVSCLPNLDRVLLCLDVKTGGTLWQRIVFRAPLESTHALNSHASSTPVTDGRLVYVTFLEVDGSTVPAPNVSNDRPVTPGRMVVAAYDFDGNRQWLAKPGEFVCAHGFASSGVLYKDLLIVNGDHDGESYVLALDKTTGKTVWKVPREYKTRSYVTPIIREIGGRTQMVFSGSMCILSLDPSDGSRHWRIEGPTEQFVASIVDDGRMFFMAAGFPTYHVMGIRPDGRGDVTDTHVAWHATGARCYVPSPIVVGNYLLVPDDRGTGNCFDTATGKRLWKARLGQHYSASLVTAGGLVYFLADDGTTKVVRPGPQLDVIAENELGEHCIASPAIAGDRLYLRGRKHLYCIANAAGQ